MKSGTSHSIPLCAIEDWSGAGFHIKQSLNVGQPTVSQVVSSPNNQSCQEIRCCCCWWWWLVWLVWLCVCGVQQHTHTSQLTTHTPHHNTTQLRRLLLGRSGKQASKTQHSAAMGKGAHWWTATSAGLNRAGFGAVELLRSSRFLLMQDSCGLSIGCDDGGVCPPLSKAVWPPH